MVKKRLFLLFRRLPIFVLAPGTIAGVTGAVIACGASSGGGVQQTGEQSSLQKGEYKSNAKQLDVVALGDSVTAGYTTLEYDGRTEDGDNREGSYSAYLKRLLQGASKNNPNGRVSSYNNLAVSGAKTADLLRVIDDPANNATLSNADLFVGTIGANDILQSVLIAGIPYRTISDLLQGLPVSLFVTGDQSQDLFFYFNLEETMDSVVDGNMAALFRPDFSFNGQLTFKNIFKNLLANFESSIKKLHDKSPNAMIVFNKYIYPFNRFIQNGREITDLFYKEDAIKYNQSYGLPEKVRTFHDAFDYIMESMEKVAAAFPYVIWNDMQQDEDELVTELVETKKVNNANEALKLMQADKADIHPTEFAHALTARKIFNDVLVPLLGEDTSSATFDDVMQKVANGVLGKTQTINVLADFLLKNKGDETPDNVFVAKLFKLIKSRFVKAAGIPSGPLDFDSIIAKTAYGKLYKLILPAISSGSFDNLGLDLVPALAEALYDIFYGEGSQEVLAAFIAPKVFAPTEFLDSLEDSRKATAMSLLQKIAILPGAFNNGVYSLLSDKVYSSDFSASDKKAIQSNFAFNDEQMKTKSSFEAALSDYYQNHYNDWKNSGWIGPLEKAKLKDRETIDIMFKQAKLLREWVGIANAIANIFPQAFYEGYAPGKTLIPLTLENLQPDQGLFKLVKLP